MQQLRKAYQMRRHPWSGRGRGGGSGGAERRDDDREAERLDGSSCFRLRCSVHRPAQRKGEQGGELLEAWIWLQALLPSADPSAFSSCVFRTQSCISMLSRLACISFAVLLSFSQICSVGLCIVLISDK
uniref:Uncharacterized protein n=1 Tax=Setaria italica TaxID=4555 RepID=K3XU79_SETIT